MIYAPQEWGLQLPPSIGCHPDQEQKLSIQMNPIEVTVLWHLAPSRAFSDTCLVAVERRSRAVDLTLPRFFALLGQKIITRLNTPSICAKFKNRGIFLDSWVDSRILGWDFKGSLMVLVVGLASPSSARRMWLRRDWNTPWTKGTRTGAAEIQQRSLIRRQFN